MQTRILLAVLFSGLLAFPVIAQEIDYDARDGMFINFDDDTYEWFTWDCSSPSAVEFTVTGNPDPTGINTSDSVGYFITSSCTWEGVAFNARFKPIDFSQETVFKIKVWALDTGLVFLLKLEDYDNNSIFHQVEARTTKFEEWEELSFDFTGAASETYHKIALFPDFGATNEYDWFFDDVRLDNGEVSRVSISDNAIEKFQLHQNYPNPFNASTIIKYSLVEPNLITLKVYNLIGQEIATLVNEHQIAGEHLAQWTAEDMPNGVYFYTLKAGGFSKTNKLILLK